LFATYPALQNSHLQFISMHHAEKPEWVQIGMSSFRKVGPVMDEVHLLVAMVLAVAADKLNF
jgi:hypothetical protein